MDLSELGWCEFFANSFAAFAGTGVLAGRVSVQHRGAYEVQCAEGGVMAEVSGRFRHQAFEHADFPAVGDWVVMEMVQSGEKAVIQSVLPRRTTLSRNSAGDTTEEQVLAANVDDVFVVEALTGELNLRRIERFLTLAGESGAKAVALLTKSDLCPDVASAVASVRAIAGTATVHALSSITGHGVEAVVEQLRGGRTGVLLGPSGVGKSTLINLLTGDDLQDVQPVRESDAKGRHTTTRRELIPLPGGGMLIDTPGLRELQLWEGNEGLGLEEAFEDIETLALNCRFTNCQHETEPGCAVIQAVTNGQLEQARLESHRKLKREMAWFERRHDARAQAEQRRRMKTINRSLRAQYKKRAD